MTGNTRADDRIQFFLGGHAASQHVGVQTAGAVAAIDTFGCIAARITCALNSLQCRRRRGGCKTSCITSVLYIAYICPLIIQTDTIPAPSQPLIKVTS